MPDKATPEPVCSLAADSTDEPKTVWISGGLDDKESWHIYGIYTCEHKAVKRTKKVGGFVASLVMDQDLPDEPTDWPDHLIYAVAKYPADKGAENG